MQQISFETVNDKTLISTFEAEWRNSLTFPNDDYWDWIIETSQYWALILNDKLVGYACVSKNNNLLQFYLTTEYAKFGKHIFELFIKEQAIKKGFVYTNNPVFLSTAMPFQHSVKVDGYLFKDVIDFPLKEKEGVFRQAEKDDLEALVDFSHIALQAPKDWLRNYIGNWIDREEFFILETEKGIIGTSEARTTSTNPNVASLGVVVSPNYRKQGYGTYLLGKAKVIAKSKNQQAICSCSNDNLGSLKAIENNGFRILHTSLCLSF